MSDFNQPKSQKASPFSDQGAFGGRMSLSLGFKNPFKGNNGQNTEQEAQPDHPLAPIKADLAPTSNAALPSSSPFNAPFESNYVSSSGQSPSPNAANLTQQGVEPKKSRQEPNEHDFLPPVFPAAPTFDPPAPVRRAAAPMQQNNASIVEQLARIEEKSARIEERLARFEMLINRAEDAFARTSTRMEEAARAVDAAELARKIGSLRSRIEAVPRFNDMVLISLFVAVFTAGAVVFANKFLETFLK